MKYRLNNLVTILLIINKVVVNAGTTWTTTCGVKTKNPCGPDNQQCGEPFGSSSPQYHIHSLSCGMNDPNGPVFDPVHGMYHMFYQDHLAEPRDGLGSGPVYGHAVSRDLTKWARLPVAIWNDMPYDSGAIFTGSATVVDGKVVQIYPGICRKKDWDNCVTGTNFNIAYPKNASDPLYVEWEKPSMNPIVNNTQRDPSTAWKSKYGEWRLTSYDTNSYGSKDFIHWYKIGKQPGFPVGECPSFFELPRIIVSKKQTNINNNNNNNNPTHVHKCSHGGKDWMQFGTWEDGKPGEPGTWSNIGKEVLIDQGNFYASKDFYDPVKKRRINWGWAQVSPGSTLTLGREVVYNEELEQLEYLPLDEQKDLRMKQLTNIDKPQTMEGWTMLSNNDWPSDAGKQIEIVTSISISTAMKATGKFGIVVMTGDVATNTNGVYFYIDNCMKIYENENINCSVGAMEQGTNKQLFHDVLYISKTEAAIELRIFVDQTFHEAYWQNGRVAMTVNNPQQGDQLVENDVAFRSDGNDELLEVEYVNIYQVDDIWTTTEEILKTKRRDV